MAVAIALIQKEGVSLYPPVVETADFGFTPNEEHNNIVFGFKAINGVNTEVSQLIINNRPYGSLNEFCEKLVDTKLIKPATMMKLIKAGCFTHLHSSDKRETMRWFLKKYKFEPCKKLGLSQLNKMVDLDIIPDDFKLSVRMIVFKKYVLDESFLFKKHIEPNKKVPKRGYHDGWYKLEPDAQEFFTAHFGEDSIVDLQGESYIISEKKFTKEINQKIEPLKEWLSKEETLDLYNSALFQSIWNEYASGTQAAWSMEALCYYDGEHELEHVDEKKYGIVNYFELPEEPVPYDYYSRKVNGVFKPFPKFEISRIAGTVLNADNNHHIVSLLTRYGVVNVKFNRGHYSYYGKQISTKLNPDDKKKTVIEKSWLKRGNLLTIQGIRQGDMFFPKIYKDTIYLHTVNLIQEVREDGTLLLQQERAKV